MARTGTNEGVANIRQEKLQDARALAMVQSRIHGRTLKQIAEEFSVSEDTVKRSLSRAEKMDLTSRYEDYMVGRLAPLAIGALEAALVNNDAAVAMKILESIGLIKKPKDQGKVANEDDGDTWEAYLKVRKPRGMHGEPTGPQVEDQGRSPNSGTGVAETGLETVDGEIAGETRQEGE